MVRITSNINDKLYGDMNMNINKDHPQIKEFNYQTTYNTIIQDKIWSVVSNNETVFRIFLTLIKTNC